MTRSLFIITIFNLSWLFIFIGDSPIPAIRVVYPLAGDTISYDQGKLILVSASTENVPQLLLSSQWQIERMMPVSGKPEKDNFAKDFYRLFKSQATIQSFEYSFRYFNGYTKPETLMFSYFDTMSVKSLWQKPEFASIVKTIMKTDVLEIILKLRGWQDSVYTPVYDDPNGENRTLYKLHVQLVPGENRIYLSPGEKKSAVEYYTRFANESIPIADRTSHFHNSELEQSCTTCHEGLPSADSGATMTADCNVCHKEMTAAPHIHPPVESKDCSSCHSWSTEKKAVVLDLGVPETCFNCHDDKKNLIDSAKTQHPVASECTTCHSPHGTDQKRMLKNDIYSLCTTCHEEQKVNHPVGRHPLRFVKNEVTGEELSCVTCHNPHGTDNDHLIKFPGKASEVCGQCH